MKETFNLPTYKRFVYTLSEPAGRYLKNDLQAGKEVYKTLPGELKRELTQEAGVKSNTTEVLTKPEYEKGSQKLFTGLTETVWPNWFAGKHRRRSNGVKINSLLLIHFTNDTGTMNIFFFPGYFVESEQLQKSFAANVIPLILRAHFM